jgi:hypothetical protein
LSDGNLNAVEVRFNEEAQWLVMETQRVSVSPATWGQVPVELELGDGAQILLASDSSIALNGAKINLGPDSVAVVLVAPQAH